MTKAITLWKSPNENSLPSNISDIGALSDYIKAIKPRDTNKIESAFLSELYDMAAEFTWNRMINLLRDKVLSFGKDFVLEMLGRHDSGSDSSDFLSEVEIINLAADLGFINKTAKMQLLQDSETIRHYASKDAEEEMDHITALNCIKNCVKYVLSYEEDDYEFSFSNFRKKLREELITKDNELYLLLKESPYFYKKTAIRTFLNLSKTSESAELEKILANMVFILPSIWENLLPDDRRPVGFAYAEAVSDGNINLVKALKKVLLKVKGFDYVPENLRSLSFIEAANNLIKMHDGYDNFYNEAPAAKHLFSLGTSIPVPALGVCITAILTCKMGNRYGVSAGAQPYLDDLLQSITPERWEYYLSSVLPGEDRILYELLNSPQRKRWVELVLNYKLNDLEIRMKFVRGLIDSSVKKDHDSIKSYARKIIDKIR